MSSGAMAILLGAASLVCATGSIATRWVYEPADVLTRIAWVSALGAVILGVASRRAASRENRSRTLASFGLVAGVVGLAWSSLATVHNACAFQWQIAGTRTHSPSPNPRPPEATPVVETGDGGSLSRDGDGALPPPPLPAGPSRRDDPPTP
jgi:hypothetical protein